MQDFRNLQAWQKAHELALAVYKATAVFPREELYGLVSQMRPASTSIPANIAEGCGFGGDRSFARHLRIARGSSAELEYLLLLAGDLGLLDQDMQTTLVHQAREVGRMLTALINRLATAWQ